MLDKRQAPISVCMQNMYKWLEEDEETNKGAIVRLLSSLDSEGHPGLEFLCWVFTCSISKRSRQQCLAV